MKATQRVKAYVCHQSILTQRLARTYVMPMGSEATGTERLSAGMPFKATACRDMLTDMADCHITLALQSH